jgi:hypothetical protein
VGGRGAQVEGWQVEGGAQVEGWRALVEEALAEVTRELQLTVTLRAEVQLGKEWTR